MFRPFQDAIRSSSFNPSMGPLWLFLSLLTPLLPCWAVRLGSVRLAIRRAVYYRLGQVTTKCKWVVSEAVGKRSHIL